MEWYIYVLSIIGGFLAGFINTLAGSGSLITLPILIFLGLPANIANGTNRLGVVLQTAVAVITLKKKGAIKLSGSQWLIIPAMIGAVPGAYIAIDLTDQVLKNVIGIIMLIMLIPIFLNSNKWLRESAGGGESYKKISVIFVFFLIGAYGGFIQAGVGIFLLSGLVLLANFTLNHSNALKNLIVFCFSIPALFVFLANGQVNWELGLLLASGQMLGSWIAVRFVIDYKHANVWVRRLLIVMIAASAAHLFGLTAIMGL